jgi:polyhydroxyalkanoate synthase
LQATAEELNRQLEQVDADAFHRALEAEAWQRIDGFIRGIEAYRQHPSRRNLPDVPVVWQEGSTRLFDYSLPDAGGPPVLVVPSLINRAYILDLTSRRSLMRYLAARGLRPFLIDWDAPGAAEKDFAIEDYVAGRLSRSIDVILGLAGRPSVVGYCMGGLLAFAVCLLRQSDINGLALLAAPWDFHAPTADQGRLVAALEGPLDHIISLCGHLPVDLLQSMFSTIDPSAIDRKFRAFGRLKTRSAKARDFVAVEDWLNDGVPLTAAVARECLFGWYVDNLPGKGEWRLAGTPMLPAHFVKPALAVVPAQDRIVPPASALAFASALPRVKTRVVGSGHIGMTTGARAATDLYAPLGKWLQRVGTLAH